MMKKKETRVQRYSKTNRMKNKIKKMGAKGILLAILDMYIKLTIKISKWLLINSFYLTVALLYLAYQFIKFFDNMVAKFFMSLPRIMKVVTIYLLIFNLGMDVYDIVNAYNKVGNKTKIETTLKSIEKTIAPVVNYDTIIAEKVCAYDKTSCLIISKAKEVGMNDEQALISVAIAKWETGNYTSVAFNQKNNVGGMMCKSGLINYDSLESGVNAFVSNLKSHYFDIGLDTLEKIQPKYCPIGAKNDPNNLNVNWLKGTNAKLQELKNVK